MKEHYKPIIAKAHTAPYKIHRYFARRPWNVFKQIIEVYSSENDIVLDPFCGGGVTIYEGVKLGRKLIGFDLNPLSIFIIENMVKRDVSIHDIDLIFNKIQEYISYLYGDYNTLKINNEKKDIAWNELAFNIYCNKCGQLVPLSNDNKESDGKYFCKNNKCQSSKKNGGFIRPSECERDGYSYLFCVIKEKKKNIVVQYNKELSQLIKDHIAFLKNELKKQKIIVKKHKIPIDWDRQHEDLLHRKGIEYFEDFFTERNLLINALVLDFIKKLHLEDEVYKLIRLIFSSSLRETNIMAFTNEKWQSGNPTTWAKHAFWIPSQFCEVNIKDSFRKAYQRVRASVVWNKEFDYSVKKSTTFSEVQEFGNLLLINQSISDSDIPENSIDTIITDPPYGSNVQYLELSHFWHIWNEDMYKDVAPDFSKEAICNRKKNFKGSKDMATYENNLFQVFQKSFFVLKPNRKMILTFNNKDMGAWMALLISIFRAGFTLENNGLFFQDGVENYKQTAHTKYDGSPYGDFIYVFIKDEFKKHIKKMDENEFIEEIDNAFKNFLNKKNGKENRNKTIKEMFLSVIPQIEIFIKSGNIIDRKKLYTHFNKDYLDLIY